MLQHTLNKHLHKCDKNALNTIFQCPLQREIIRCHDYRNQRACLSGRVHASYAHEPRFQSSAPIPQRQTRTQLHKDEGCVGGQRQHCALGRSQLPGSCWDFRNWELSHQQHLTPAAGLGTRVVAAPPPLDKRARDIHSHTTALQLCVPAFRALTKLHPRTLPTALNSTPWSAVGQGTEGK